MLLSLIRVLKVNRSPFFRPKNSEQATEGKNSPNSLERAFKTLGKLQEAGQLPPRSETPSSGGSVKLLTFLNRYVNITNETFLGNKYAREVVCRGERTVLEHFFPAFSPLKTISSFLPLINCFKEFRLKFLWHFLLVISLRAAGLTQ